MIEWTFFRVVSDLLNGYMYLGRIDELENKKVKVLRNGKVHCRKNNI